MIPNAREARGAPFDARGFAFSGGACVAVMYGMELLGQPGAGFGTAGVVLAMGLGLGVLAVRHMRRAAHPLLDIAALRIRTYRVSMVGGSIFRVAISTVPFLLPLMFQLAFGLDAFASGLLVLAVFAGNLGIKPATSWILRRWGFRRVLLGNGLLMTASLAACGLLWPSTPWPVVAVVLFWGGVCRSMQFTAVATIAFADVPRERLSGTNTLSSVAQQLTMGMGIAAGAMALRLGAALLGDAGGTSVADFHLAFFVIAAVTLLAVPETLALPAEAGASISGHRLRLRRGRA